MSRKKTPEREALTIAAELMADMGCCIHDAGYQCTKDIPAACPACIRRWLLKKARGRYNDAVVQV
jgi:hypothetical protein